MSRFGGEQLEQRMPRAYLQDRGAVGVSGPEAKTLLDNLITCDLDKVSPEASRYGALLAPQGKILFDFIVFSGPGADGGYVLDVDRAVAADLTKRLNFYKLRAKVAIEDLTEKLAIVAGWDGAPPPAGALAIAPDPRLDALGWRAIVTGSDAPGLAEGTADAYHVHRIGLGVPEGGKDFSFGETFPHEALMDQLCGVDFDKGCYVGQEVVSRMQHRGTARTRIVPARYPGGGVADRGAAVTAGEKVLGKAGTGAAGRGLLMIRLDRAQDAIAEGKTILAGGLPVRLEKPSWAGFAFPGEATAALNS